MPLTSCQDIPHIVLHATKLDKSAALALQMVKHASQSVELHPTSSTVRTVVDLLHMGRAVQMLLQIPHPCKLASAKITFVSIPVPRVCGGPFLFVPFYHVVRDDAIAVTVANGMVNGLTIDIDGVRAGAGFEMMCDASSGSKASVAKGAWNFSSLMSARSEMLRTNS